MASRTRRSESVVVGASTEVLRRMCWMIAMTEGSDGGGGVH